jgi:hypothetical protein
MEKKKPCLCGAEPTFKNESFLVGSWQSQKIFFHWIHVINHAPIWIDEESFVNELVSINGSLEDEFLFATPLKIPKQMRSIRLQILHF